MACLILFLTSSFMSKMWSLYEILSSFRKHLISVACNLFSSILHVLCQCLGFAGVQDYQDNQGEQFDLLAKGDILFVPDGLQFR